MLKQIGESDYKYLWYDPITGSGHGLDEAYISKLGNFAGTFDQSKTVIPITDINTMNQIGKNSFTLASTDPAYLANLGYTGTPRNANNVYERPCKWQNWLLQLLTTKTTSVLSGLLME